MTTLRFSPEDHRYFEGETELPSLSKILRLGGIAQDLSGVPPHVLERKKQIGTALHLAVELHLNDNLEDDSVDEQVRPYFVAAQNYLGRESRKILAIETPVGSVALGYACTPDLVVEGGIVEWKTTYKIYPEVEVQLAGQARAVANYTDGVGSRWSQDLARRVVQLKPDGTYVVKDYGPDADSVFDAALTVAKWKIAHEPRRRASSKAGSQSFDHSDD